MPTQLTANDARESLTTHVAAKGIEIQAKYGPGFGWAELQRLLEDRVYVRYPCEIRFDATALQQGEFAHPEQKGATPEDGFTIHVHPLYSTNLDRVAWLVLYQLVAVNYGQFASSAEAEVFGASVLGIDPEEYYQVLCAMADQLGSPGEGDPTGNEPDSAEGGGGCGGECSCW
jgi:hypothetical protein